VRAVDTLKTRIEEISEAEGGFRTALIAGKQLLTSRSTMYIYSAVAMIAALVTDQAEAVFIILILAVASNVMHVCQASHARRLIERMLATDSKQSMRRLADIRYVGPEIASWFADFLTFALLSVAVVSLLVHRSWESVIPVFVLAGALNVRAVSQLPMIRAIVELGRSGVVVKGASQIEQLASVDTFAFDETRLVRAGTREIVMLQPGADKRSVQLLRQMKLNTILLTAEEEVPAQQRAAMLGMNECEWELFPEDAQHKIATILDEGRRIAVVKSTPDTLSPRIVNRRMPARSGTGGREFLQLDTTFTTAVKALHVSRKNSRLVELILAIYLVLTSISLGMTMATVLRPAAAAFTAYGTDLILLFCFGWFLSKSRQVCELGSAIQVNR
jgi:hypothetical protein